MRPPSHCPAAASSPSPWRKCPHDGPGKCSPSMAPCSGATDAIPAARAQNCARIPGTPTASSGSSASSPARKHPGAAPASHTGPCSRSPGFRSAGNSPPLPPVPARVSSCSLLCRRTSRTLLFLYTPGHVGPLADLMAPLFDQEPLFPSLGSLFCGGSPRCAGTPV